MRALGGDGIDTTVPHSARIWNYWLGGKDNYAVDRQAGDAWLLQDPSVRDLARASRDFLRQAVGYLVDSGVRQFLDVGTGLPTADNTHEIAQRLAPDARIVYVDNDPLVLAHARVLLRSTPEVPRATSTPRCATPPRSSPRLPRFSTSTSPSPCCSSASSDMSPTSAVGELVDALPSGSYLVVSDGGRDNPAQARAAEEYAATGAVPYVLRTRTEVAEYFRGLEFVGPGLATVNEWRPSPLDPGVASITAGPGTSALAGNYGGIARKK